MTQTTTAPAHSGKADTPTEPLFPCNLTDKGNAERIILQHSGELRFIEDTGHWINWESGYWQMDKARSAARWRMMQTITSMHEEAGSSAFTGDRKALSQWALTSESRVRIDSAVSLAKEHPQITTRITELDADPMLLGVRNGVVNLRTGVLGPADPDNLITHQVATEFDPDAKCPLWERTLERIQPDPVLRSFLHRCIGYSLTALTGEQVMFLVYGRGANGKSLVVETLLELLGGYSQKAPSDLLLARSASSDLSNDVARLRGARLVAAIETDEGRKLAEARVKEITGGDRISARFLHKEFFEFRPVSKLWLVTNHKPRISGTDDGIWRRIVQIPFSEYISEADRDLDLAQKLRRELPGILAWAVRGCLDWQKQGLNKPRAVIELGKEYRADQDVLGGFLDDRCVQRERVSVTAKALYAEYQSWCEENGHAPSSQTMFGSKLRDRGFQKEKKGTVIWHGVALRAATPAWERVPDFAADPELAPQLAAMEESPTPVPESTCRVCGDPCDPVCEGVHVNCVEPSDDADDAPDPDDDGPQGGAGGPHGPIGGPTTPNGSAAAAAQEPSERLPPVVATVTARRRRPWTAKSTAFITWSSGAGVDESGSPVTLPARARIDGFLTALPGDVQRVVLVGSMPGKTGPGLQSWATGDLPQGWSESPAGHYLDPDALAARYRREDGTEVHVHRLASWVRDTDGSTRPETACHAFALLRAGLGEIFGRRRQVPGKPAETERVELAPAILSSPASTGRELLLRSLPAGHEYPVLDPEHIGLLHHTTGQGRNELLTAEGYPADELPGLYGYDMRWAYAALCRGVTGCGPATLDTGTEFLGFAPARYEVEFRVPDGWDHLGLLGVHGEGWPSTPGTRWRTWCDARELRLADRWGWKLGQDVTITRRLLLTPDKSAPLRTWADKLTEIRETWLPAQDAPAPVIALARDMTRTVLLASLGALQGRRQKVTHAVPQDRAGEIPADAAVTVAGGMLVWQTETAAGWREMVHPEWVGQVWAEQRCRLLDTGPKAAQASVGALHVPRSELVALRTDAVYSTTDPGWPDGGKVGQFRRQLALTDPVPTPRTIDALMALRAEG